MISFRSIHKALATSADVTGILGYTPVKETSGTWTPVLTFATPGNLAVTYSIQAGWWRKQDGEYVLDFSIVTSAFTFTTSSGNLQITGVPLAAANDSNYLADGALLFQGITKAGYTQFTPYILAGAQLINVSASSSASATSDVTAADMPTGGTVRLRGTLRMRV